MDGPYEPTTRACPPRGHAQQSPYLDAVPRSNPHKQTPTSKPHTWTWSREACGAPREQGYPGYSKGSVRAHLPCTPPRSPPLPPPRFPDTVHSHRCHHVRCSANITANVCRSRACTRSARASCTPSPWRVPVRHLRAVLHPTRPPGPPCPLTFVSSPCRCIHHGHADGSTQTRRRNPTRAMRARSVLVECKEPVRVRSGCPHAD